VGRQVSEVVPGTDPFWVEAYARVVETGEPAHVERFVPQLGRWFEVRAHRTGPDRFAALVLDATERRRAEEGRTLLLHELNHRVKNTLASVQSIALQTVRGAADLPSFAATFQARLIALARAHDLLTRRDWQGAPLADVARAALHPASGGDEARVDLGACAADVLLPPPQALALTLALHELATNALKHGAFSTPDGHVSIVCETDPDSGSNVIEWVERGGPRIQGPPARRGFGLRLLQRGLASQAGLASDLRFEPEGLRCTLRLPPAPS
jgi:two-component sensor histidine kinase